VKTADVIAHFGSVSAVADALGISPQAIYQWGELVPQGRTFQIQILTNGSLRAEAQKVAA